MQAERKALLVGSSFSAAPIYFALKKHGLHVSVCGNLRSDPCHQYADRSFYIDYSKPEELAGVIDAEHFDYVVPTCNDYSYLAAAAVCDGRKFFGIDPLPVAKILHTKNEFRRAAELHGIPIPRFRRHARGEPVDAGGLAYPLLVKPVDSFSGRGVTKVADARALPAALHDAQQASLSGEVVLEEFVEGNLHSHSAFIQDGRVAIDFFVDEFCSVYPYQVDCSNHPSVLDDSLRARVRETMNHLVAGLGLADGLLHTQFIANGSRFWIIECMRRCPGDLYGHLVSFSTGVDYADLYVRGYMNMRLPEDTPRPPARYFGRHTISVAKPRVAFSFSNTIPARSVEVVPLKSSGEMLGVAPFDKLAILFAEYDDRATMLDVTPRLADLIQIRTLGAEDA